MSSITEMKAVRIHSYGGQNALIHEKVEKPVIQNDEVLIRVVNTSVNPVDWKVREGWLANDGLHTLPLILGWDVSGVIDEIGSAVVDFKLGQSVYACGDISKNGAYAEYIAVKAEFVSLKPSTVSFAEASSVPLAALTAWQALDTIAKVQPGETVMIHGASGGVGSFAVQFAKLLGANVTAISSSQNHEYLLALGADQVIDYKERNYLSKIEPFDVVFDVVDNDVDGIYNSVKSNGRYISTLKKHDIPNDYSFFHDRVVISPSGSDLNIIAKYIDDDELQIPNINIFNIEDVGKAHALSEKEHIRGKIVINVE